MSTPRVMLRLAGLRRKRRAARPSAWTILLLRRPIRRRRRICRFQQIDGLTNLDSSGRAGTGRSGKGWGRVWLGLAGLGLDGDGTGATLVLVLSAMPGGRSIGVGSGVASGEG